MFGSVFSLIYTTKDLERLRRVVVALKEGLYKSKVETPVESEMIRVVREAMDRGQVGRREFLERLEQELESVPVLGLTLSFEPSGEMVERLVQWAREQVNPRLVVDIRVDQSILGGARVEYEGEYRDVTLAKKLDNFLAELEQLEIKDENFSTIS